MGADKLRVAVVGCGSMANRAHYPSLASFEDVTIAAACDLDAAKLAETADKYGIEGRYSDYRKMVEEVAPEAIYVIGPPHLLFDVWCWCLREGLNLFVEKPLGLTIHQARTLAHLAAEHGCITQVGFQRRSSPMVCRLRDRCLERGPISHAVCRFYKHAPEPFLQARDHMMDDGVHGIDTVRWLCGGEVTAIHSSCRRNGTPDINFISAMMEFDTGATGFLIQSWTSGRRIFDVEIHAPGIAVEAEHEVGATVFADGDTAGEQCDAAEVAGGSEFHIVGGFQAKHREFIDAIQAGNLPSSHFGDAVKTMEIAETILAQALMAGR